MIIIVLQYKKAFTLLLLKAQLWQVILQQIFEVEQGVFERKDENFSDEQYYVEIQLSAQCTTLFCSQVLVLQHKLHSKIEKYTRFNTGLETIKGLVAQQFLDIFS